MLVYEIDNVLYSDLDVYGENKPDFCMPIPSDEVLPFQIQVEDGVIPELWAIANDETIYKIAGTLLGSNYYWSLSLPSYPLLFNKCITFLIVDTTTTDADEGVVNDVILESEPLCINSGHDSIVKVSYRNNEPYDTILFDENYTGIFYIPATLIQNPLKEESKEYIRSDGSTVKLSSRQYSIYDFKTDYLPRYMHEIFALILSLDSVVFNTTAMVGDSYTFSNIERFALSQGGVNLTRTLYNKLNSNCS